MDHISLEIGFGIGFFLGPLVYYIFKKIWKGTRCTWVARQLTAIDFIADLHRIDMAIADYIKKTFNLSIGDKTSEDIKIKIGSAVPLEEELTLTIKGRDFVSGLPRSVEIKTNEIVKAISGELREMIKAIKDVLQETPPELSADIIDQGIIMTGGSSLLRHFPELVFRRIGVKATLADDALYCVAKGTGIALDHLDTYKKSIISKR